MAKYAILELTEAEAKLLVASKTKKAPLTIEAVSSVELGDLGKDEEGQATRIERIRKALDRVRLAGAVGGILLPKQQAIVRTAQLPSTDPTELAGMVQFEAEKFIPFNADRHVISHGIIRSEGELGSHVLMAAVDGPVIEFALQASKAIGLEAVVAEVSSISLTRAFLSEVKPTSDHDHSILLLHIGRHSAEICILRDGALEAARSQTISLDRLAEETQAAGNDWLEVEVENPAMQEWIVRLMRFVRQTIEFASREHDVPAPKIAYLSGEGTRIDGLAGSISMNLGISVVPFLPGTTLARAKDISAEHIAGVANCVGLLERLVAREDSAEADDDRINLLPRIVLEQQAASERRLLLMVSAAMVLITLVLVYLAFDMQARHSSELGKRYLSYNREMRPLVEDIELKEERLEIIEQIRKDQASPLYVLDQLTTFPSIGSTDRKGRLTLSNFKFTQAGDITVEGMALDLEDISLFADYMQKLSWKEQPLFGEVGIPQSQPSDSLGRNRPRVWTFSINCRLFNPDTDTAEEKE
ncbi:hypothetical protein GC173_04050 [bacterium]|nr:hypothetical protein [bacterium]